MDPERFLKAQADPDVGHDAALAQLRSGRKTGHWIWWTFPQLAGLGRSEVSRRFGLAGFDEARQYLEHPVLSLRLQEAMSAVAVQVGEGKRVVDVLGDVDARKLVSCCTLFQFGGKGLATPLAREARKQANRVALMAKLLLEEAEKEGLPPCLQTLDAMPDEQRCPVCGGPVGPDSLAASALMPTSYERCQTCQEEGIELESIFESVVLNGFDLPNIEKFSTMIDGERVMWSEWLRRRGER